MSKKFNAFWARDAIAYVDAYRRLLHMGATQIEGEKRRLEEKLWNRTESDADSRMLAELRATEHALGQVVSEEEPGLVILNEGSAEEAQKQLDKQEAERNATIQQMQGKINEAQLQVKKLNAALEGRQAEMVELNQRNVILQRKLNEQRASSMVISGVSLLVVAVLITIIVLRG